ncbi:hypothetical protein B6N60_00478 [Richelia sinica FACHB-800]|uniref:Uncharacterized protein n=1 Tax=Richelia sinica FACHB-800 TaxID=1357546 RepID=A0A975T4H9_9NOST|nr:hypothetical protein B6N60_00478 [Richelia sinica FACHB-800]
MHCTITLYLSSSFTKVLNIMSTNLHINLVEFILR